MLRADNAASAKENVRFCLSADQIVIMIRKGIKNIVDMGCEDAEKIFPAYHIAWVLQKTRSAETPRS